jgi:hypothetical protein
VRETLGCFYPRETETPHRAKIIRARLPHPFQRLDKRFAERSAAEALFPLRKLTNGEVHLLLAGAPFAQGYTADLRYRPMEAWALGLASHLARSRLSRRLGQETFLLRTRDLLLLVSPPLVSTPATNRARTLR